MILILDFYLFLLSKILHFKIQSNSENRWLHLQIIFLMALLSKLKKGNIHLKKIVHLNHFPIFFLICPLVFLNLLQFPTLLTRGLHILFKANKTPFSSHTF